MLAFTQLKNINAIKAKRWARTIPNPMKSNQFDQPNAVIAEGAAIINIEFFCWCCLTHVECNKLKSEKRKRTESTSSKIMQKEAAFNRTFNAMRCGKYCVTSHAEKSHFTLMIGPDFSLIWYRPNEKAHLL